MVPKNWKDYVIWILAALVMGLGTMYGFIAPSPLPPPPIPIWEPTQDDFGWHADPEAVKAILDDLKQPIFAMTEAGQYDEPLPAHVYLWEAYRKLDPRGPPTKNQNPVGSCVSFGTNNAIIRTMACEIVFGKRPFELKDIVEEVTYAGSRVEVGGGRIRGDGSVGAWAAKFVKDWGVINRGVHGKYDLSTYSPTRCREWGRSGVPDDLEPKLREHPVQSITLVRTWDDAKRALAQGYAIAICSNQGFSMSRDSRGVAAPRGSWAHCMCLDGYHKDANGSEYGHIENSWGASAHTGPVGWGNPSTAGFWADSSVIARMLRAGDSWAFSAVQGFPARKIDWFVIGPNPLPERRHALKPLGGVRDEVPVFGLFGRFDGLPGVQAVPLSWRRERGHRPGTCPGTAQLATAA